MNTNKKNARIAGLLYFLLVITGIFSLLYVPSQIYVSGDPAATLENINSRNTLFRLGMAVEIVSYSVFLLLPLALYRLLHTVDKQAAVVMVALAVASVPISIGNVLHEFGALQLATAPVPQDPTQLYDQLMLYMKQYFNGHLVSQIFWSLWLLPLGYLVYNSGILPKILGIFLMLGSLGYLIDFFGKILFPEYSGSVLAEYITIPASIGEIGTCLWLLIMGARPWPEAREKQV